LQFCNRLPSPEEKARVTAQVFAAQVVRLDVTGAGFQRMTQVHSSSSFFSLLSLQLNQLHFGTVFFFVQNYGSKTVLACSFLLLLQTDRFDVAELINFDLHRKIH